MITYQMVAWVPMILFFFAPLVQAIKNWRNKSAKGISQATIILCLTGLMCSVIYDVLMALPFAYQVMHPLILAGWSILAFQEYWYSGRAYVRRSLVALYVGIASMGIGLYFWGQYYPLQVGAVTGWMFTIFYSTFQIPQIYKNYQERSVAGLSFWYLTLMAMASCMDLGLTFHRLLPVQSLANAIRGITVYFIFVYQFSLYRSTIDKK
jgi:uncharacterized protein with PQ loop repeat